MSECLCGVYMFGVCVCSYLCSVGVCVFVCVILYKWNVVECVRVDCRYVQCVCVECWCACVFVCVVWSLYVCVDC